MQHLYTTFFTLLRSALTASDAPGSPASPNVSDTPVTLVSPDWHALYDLSRQQALTGVIYHAVSHLQLPLPLAMQWMTDAEAIRGANALQNREASRLTRLNRINNRPSDAQETPENTSVSQKKSGLPK